MSEIINLILSLSQKIIDIKSRIELLRLSRAERLKDTCMDNQDVLQTFRKHGTLYYSKVRGKFYYKVSDIEELLHCSYYNQNFKCDGVK